MGAIATVSVYGDEIEGNSLPSTPISRPATQRSVTKAPGCAPASVSANAFSNPSRTGGGAGKGLTWRKEGRDDGKIGGPGGSHTGGLFPHWVAPVWKESTLPMSPSERPATALLSRPARAPSSLVPLSLRIMDLSGGPLGCDALASELRTPLPRF